MIGYALVALVAALLIFLVWVGFFKSIKIEPKVFPGGTFIYKDYKGSVKQLGTAHSVILRDLAAWKSTQPKNIITPCMGIYYDDPYNIKDPESFRASIGILSSFKNDEMINFYTSRGYKIRQLPKVNSIYGSFPYKCSLSFPLAASKYYPASLRYMKNNQEY